MPTIEDMERNPESFLIEPNGEIRRRTPQEQAEQASQEAQRLQEGAIHSILGPQKDPVPLDADEKARLLEQFRGILGSGVTRDALEDPSSMSLEDIVLNLNLYNRLFIALGLLTKMKGYSHDPAWLNTLCSKEELEAALRSE